MAHVQIADVQCDLQTPSEHVAYRAALQVVPTAFPAMVAAPMEVEKGQPMQIDLATPRAGQSELQDSAEARTPQQRSLGVRRSCWSWRRPCRRCVPSGTRRGA